MTEIISGISLILLIILSIVVIKGMIEAHYMLKRMEAHIEAARYIREQLEVQQTKSLSEYYKKQPTK